MLPGIRSFLTIDFHLIAGTFYNAFINAFSRERKLLSPIKSFCPWNEVVGNAVPPISC
jgi:hypothetical protein